MNRHLFDLNAGLALLDPLHVFHEAAHRCVEVTPAGVAHRLADNGTSDADDRPSSPFNLPS